MERLVRIGSYSDESGLRLEWSYGFSIAVQSRPGEVSIRANEAGLRSLAQHMLTLAEESVPDGAHIHLDASRELEADSEDLVIERSDSLDGGS